MPEHGSKRPQTGATAWPSGGGSQPGLFDRPRLRRSPVKTTADRAKISTLGLNALAIQTTQ